jgi:hypothetical protein
MSLGDLGGDRVGGSGRIEGGWGRGCRQIRVSAEVRPIAPYATTLNFRVALTNLHPFLLFLHVILHI